MKNHHLSRRLFLGHGLVSFAAVMGCSSEDSGSKKSGGIKLPDLESLISDIGELGEPDANGVRLPPGFTSRIVARSSERPLETSDYVWHSAPDGGATYPTEDGGWIYVSNSEVPLIGGVGALRFDANAKLVGAYRILDDTNVNCAGGPTPWGTWLSCEEIAKGKVFECDPFGKKPSVDYPALGVFKHEAVAVDPVNHQLFLTEDESDGRFYRFLPEHIKKDGHPDLTSGKLQVAQVMDDNRVVWHDLPDPTYEGTVGTRRQIPESTEFRGGEGIWYHNGFVYFSTKRDDRIWEYNIKDETIRVFYDAETHPDPILEGVDNITVSASGDVLVAEDGGDMQIVAILPDGSLKALVQVTGHEESEITGPAFDPSGTRLYFSSQRGAENRMDRGVTYEITGPFHREKIA